MPNTVRTTYLLTPTTSTATINLLFIYGKGFNAGSYSLAITGKSWAVIQQYYSELIPECVVKGTIFARMSPDQKQQLVQALQTTGYYVGQLSSQKMFTLQ